MASIPAGLLLGILAALLVERFQAPLPRTVWPEPEPVLRPAPVPVLSPLPPVLARLSATTDLRVADWVVDNSTSSYGQALTALVHAVAPTQRGQARVVALTSAAHDYGKAVIALSLARTASRIGLRVLLIDGDLGRSVPGVPGLSGLLSGVPLDRVLMKDRRTGAWFLPAAGSDWTAPRIAELFAYLRRSCDLILIDAAPAAMTRAWAAQARLSDSILLVAAANAPQPVFEAALRSLVATKTPPSGLIVTC
jgi:Mrp family chromosome partitioning ATPase